MNKQRLVSLFTAMIALFAIPTAALADVWINGHAPLQPWDKNQCSYNGNGFHCNPSYGRSTVITFVVNPHGQNRESCALRVENQGSLFKGDKWHIYQLPPANPKVWKPIKCRIDWAGRSNTADIYKE